MKLIICISEPACYARAHYRSTLMPIPSLPLLPPLPPADRACLDRVQLLLAQRRVRQAERAFAVAQICARARSQLAGENCS